MSRGAGPLGCVNALGTLVLAAALGYNIWQVRGLQAEVSALKAAQNKKPSLSVGQSLPRLQEAKFHAERGQKLLKARRFKEAQQELALAAQKTQEATGAASSGRVSGQDMEKLLSTLSKQAGALWEQDKEARKR
jgi:hypothetical protein